MSSWCKARLLLSGLFFERSQGPVLAKAGALAADCPMPMTAAPDAHQDQQCKGLAPTPAAVRARSAPSAIPPMKTTHLQCRRASSPIPFQMRRSREVGVPA
jgi:hypothetical protein